MKIPSEIEKRAANLAAWPLAAAAFVIAIPFYQTIGEYEVFTFNYWGGGDDFNRMEVIRNFALIVGGFLGLWLAWRRIVLMDQQTEVALQDSKQKEMDHVAARYENAIALLESEDEMSRIAAVSGLQGVALAHGEMYLRPTVRLLCAFVRKNRPVTEEVEVVTSEFEEIFAALKTLIDRLETIQDGRMSDVDLRNVSFDGLTLIDWDFSVINVLGSTMRGSLCRRCRFHGTGSRNGKFQRTVFIDCDFVGNFTAPDFEFCEFIGPLNGPTSFSSANLKHTAFDGVFEIGGSSLFQGCQIDGMTLSAGPQAVFHYGAFMDIQGDNAFRPYNFVDCWVLETEEHPFIVGENNPPLVAEVNRPRPDGGFYIAVREATNEELASANITTEDAE